jgi:hypothetical protein
MHPAVAAAGRGLAALSIHGADTEGGEGSYYEGYNEHCFLHFYSLEGIDLLSTGYFPTMKIS